MDCIHAIRKLSEDRPKPAVKDYENESDFTWYEVDIEWGPNRDWYLFRRAPLKIGPYNGHITQCDDDRFSECFRTHSQLLHSTASHFVGRFAAGEDLELPFELRYDE